MSSFLSSFPVGFPGEQKYASLMLESCESAFEMAGTSRSKLGVCRGTFTREMSFTCADTLYMPYVGGQVRILSLPGTQKARIKASIASSEPTPQKRWAGVMFLEVWVWVLRRLQKSCLRSSWWLYKI